MKKDKPLEIPVVPEPPTDPVTPPPPDHEKVRREAEERITRSGDHNLRAQALDLAVRWSGDHGDGQTPTLLLAVADTFAHYLKTGEKTPDPKPEPEK